MDKSTCSQPACGKPAKARGVCAAHYYQLRRSGGMQKLQPRVCNVDGCGKKHSSHGFCENHARKWQRNGTPDGEDRSLDTRFWSKVVKTDSCWVWIGARNHLGYGHIHVSKSVGRRGAHRVSYEMLVGPIPAWATDMDHLCRNPPCVNPAHLEPVTHAENLRRAPRSAATVKRDKTHCPQGHPYSGENLVINSKGRRECRTCRRAAYLRYRDRNISVKPAATPHVAPGGATTKEN